MNEVNTFKISLTDLDGNDISWVFAEVDYSLKQISLGQHKRAMFAIEDAFQALIKQVTDKTKGK